MGRGYWVDLDAERLRRENDELRDRINHTGGDGYEYCLRRGHSWENMSVLARCCYSDGSNLYVCRRCGAEKSE